MDLILWRHADAQDWGDDGDPMLRALTPRGFKQATRMATWLDRQLPDGTRILCSPTLRCEQTAKTLGRKFRLLQDLGAEATPDALLEAAQWPMSKHAVLVVSHQPLLGQTIAQLLPFQHPACPVRKGAVWWLRTRERDGHQQTVVAAVQSPEML